MQQTLKAEAIQTNLPSNACFKIDCLNVSALANAINI